MSQQRSLTTVAEGGIPSEATHVLHLAGSNLEEPSTSTSLDARISTIPLSESLGLPLEEPNTHDVDPPWWPSTQRGMPTYRPLNRHVDYTERPMGQNSIEWTFLQFMFTGVRAVGLGNIAWRSTVGKITDSVFKYPVGGQW